MPRIVSVKCRFSLLRRNFRCSHFIEFIKVEMYLHSLMSATDVPECVKFRTASIISAKIQIGFSRNLHFVALEILFSQFILFDRWNLKLREKFFSMSLWFRNRYFSFCSKKMRAKLVPHEYMKRYSRILINDVSCSNIHVIIEAIYRNKYEQYAICLHMVFAISDH